MEEELKCVIAVGNAGDVHYIIKTSDKFNSLRHKIMHAHQGGMGRNAIYDRIKSDPDKYFIKIV